MKAARVDRVIFVLLLGSLAVNAYVGVTGRSLFAHSSGAPPALTETGPYDSKQLAGRAAPPIDTVRLNGDSVTVAVAEKPLLLYVMSPTCGWCLRNTANIQTIAKASGSKYRLVGLSLIRNGLDDYLRDHPIPFEVFVFKNAQDPKLASYGFGATPTMYVVSLDGKIERAWGGALQGGSLRDAEAFFGFTLPGLPTAS